MANKGTADFLLFVPDNATAKVLERLMPPSPLDNVKLHVVGGGGGLVQFYRNCLGPTLEAAKFDLSERQYPN